MNIKEIMNSDVCTVTPSMSLSEAATMIQNEGIGFLVVAEGDALIGSITERGIAEGLEIDSGTVADVMTTNLLYCHEEHTVDEVASHMNEEQVQRMPVVDSDNHLTGIVSIGDMAQHLSHEVVGQALKGITECRFS